MPAAVTSSTDYGLRANFSKEMLLHDNDDFLDCVIFSNESTFHLSGHVNTHLLMCASGDPNEVVQLQQDSPKLNVFYAGGKFMGL
ncbi:hypothetical protein J437_LFUL015178 [Ladona fulva]|uniref:Uncharacterized protein n=1 Tax=Ladona fulva TaxID=123851 RepID=A0A8K0PBJ3_LADFU|nr:hypothetical protein J437_LFUL015178 [Ladona fulva]